MTNKETAEALKEIAASCDDRALEGILYAVVGSVLVGSTRRLLTHVVAFSRSELERTDSRRN